MGISFLPGQTFPGTSATCSGASLHRNGPSSDQSNDPCGKLARCASHTCIADMKRLHWACRIFCVRCLEANFGVDLSPGPRTLETLFALQFELTSTQHGESALSTL